MTGSRILVTYRAKVAAGDASDLATRIAYEQTVELPVGQVVDGHVLANVVARVESVSPDPESPAHHLISLSHSAEMANGHLPQLLNLIFGNVSIYPGVRLVAMDLPDDLLNAFRGPALGVTGLRERLGVFGRPLLASALKPRGVPAEQLADMATQFAHGGGDLIKDDQNLVDDLESFKKRVDLCSDAVDLARQTTGRECLYFPHVAAAHELLPRFVDYVEARGLAGVLICPMITGLDSARALLQERGLLCMAHPAMTGAFTNAPDGGIAHDVLLGSLFRIGGADISIFPHFGGRFSFSEQECRAISAALSKPLGALRASWPCPAGGMDLSRVADLGTTYGEDAVFLVGGALLGGNDGIAATTTRFQRAIAEQFATGDTTADGQLRQSPVPSVSGRDERESGSGEPRINRYRALPDFVWDGRESTAYKDAGDLRFKGVRRVELAGRDGERTDFDLRYFEVAPGGYSSHEKHVHAHVVIGARGIGRVRLGDESVTMARDDVIYIEPLQAHQLCNDGDEPFGFYCIVDHRRDRPMPA